MTVHAPYIGMCTLNSVPQVRCDLRIYLRIYMIYSLITPLKELYTVATGACILNVGLKISWVI